jgi:hypothetical protein
MANIFISTVQPSDTKPLIRIGEGVEHRWFIKSTFFPPQNVVLSSIQDRRRRLWVAWAAIGADAHVQRFETRMHHVRTATCARSFDEGFLENPSDGKSFFDYPPQSEAYNLPLGAASRIYPAEKRQVNNRKPSIILREIELQLEGVELYSEVINYLVHTTNKYLGYIRDAEKDPPRYKKAMFNPPSN